MLSRVWHKTRNHQRQGRCAPPTSLPCHLTSNHSAFTRVEVDSSTALAYLRGDAISIDAQQGYILVTYNGAILSFANNLGIRANNLYPKPWRIMSTHLPDTPPQVL